MSNTLELIKDLLEALEIDDTKFEHGNAAAGTRARKHLGDMAKLCKLRRAEITDTKHARQEAKE